MLDPLQLQQVKEQKHQNVNMQSGIGKVTGMCLIRQHDMMMYGGMEVKLCIFLTSELNRGLSSQCHTQAVLTTEKDLLLPTV
jgi:hypothetical protein